MAATKQEVRSPSKALWPKYPDGLGRLECPVCLEPLDLHQLDERYPDRVLGYCTLCHQTFSVRPDSGDDANWEIVGALELAVPA